jgi:hypothetical protein
MKIKSCGGALSVAPDGYCKFAVLGQSYGAMFLGSSSRTAAIELVRTLANS